MYTITHRLQKNMKCTKIRNCYAWVISESQSTYLISANVHRGREFADFCDFSVNT